MKHLFYDTFGIDDRGGEDLIFWIAVGVAICLACLFCYACRYCVRRCCWCCFDAPLEKKTYEMYWLENENRKLRTDISIANQELILESYDESEFSEDIHRNLELTRDFELPSHSK